MSLGRRPKTKSSFLNVVFEIKDRTMDNVQNCDVVVTTLTSFSLISKSLGLWAGS
jgi:hypothetical protein